MNVTLRVVLTLLLSSLAAKQLFAQAAPQDLAQAQAPQLAHKTPAVEPGASAPTPAEVLLWQPIAENRKAALEEPPVETPRERAWSDWSTEKKVLVVGGGVLALAILGIVSIG